MTHAFTRLAFTLVAVSGLALSTAAGAGSAPAAQMSIVDTAVAAGSFKTLATALEAAGLIGVLSGPGPFTVFAPTDAAFAKLPAGTVESLLRPENKAKLATILKYHVVAGELMAKDVVAKSSATPLEGKALPILVANGAVKLGAATVVQTDIDCSNGVIHVLDTVLLP